MADIQAMFYQVKEPEKQRSFVRFLWWNEGNLGSEIADHKMCVDLFEAVSSPTNGNYSLRKAVVNNSSCGGNDTAANEEPFGDDLLKLKQYAKLNNMQKI